MGRGGEKGEIEEVKVRYGEGRRRGEASLLRQDKVVGNPIANTTASFHHSPSM